ncbi:MAG: hypothetical protein KF812_08640 [Fimbriimonadaceae bacterium]|nr:hypothetical protein [Fimbriimonadaceae bacterium]
MTSKGIGALRSILPVLVGSLAVVAAVFAGDQFWERGSFAILPLSFAFQNTELLVAAVVMATCNGVASKRGFSVAQFAILGALVLGLGMMGAQASFSASGLTGFEEAIREVANFAVGGLLGGAIAGYTHAAVCRLGQREPDLHTASSQN